MRNAENIAFANESIQDNLKLCPPQCVEFWTNILEDPGGTGFKTSLNWERYQP